jgi:hypothetical protein
MLRLVYITVKQTCFGIRSFLMKREQLLLATGISLRQFESMKRRDRAAGAFGRNVNSAFEIYYPIDGIGLLLVDKLSESYNQKQAAQLTRIHFPIWGTAVAHAEQNPGTGPSLVIVDMQHDVDGVAGHLAGGAIEIYDLDALAKDIARHGEPGWTPVRVVAINIEPMVKLYRARALKHGVSLPDRLMPPPNTEAFRAIMAPFEDIRDEALIEMNRRRRHEVIAERVGARARSSFEAALESVN